jgi:hypothetical protein
MLLGGLVGLAMILMTSVAGAAIYSPTSVSFAPQVAGTQSPAQQVQVGGGYCGPDMPAPGGGVTHECFTQPSDIAVSGDFVITENTCPANYFTDALSSRLSCHVNVSFLPTGPGPKIGFLRVASTPSIQGIPLSGTGLVCFKNRKKKRVCNATGPPPKKKKKKKR